MNQEYPTINRISYDHFKTNTSSHFFAAIKILIQSLRSLKRLLFSPLPWSYKWQSSICYLKIFCQSFTRPLILNFNNFKINNYNHKTLMYLYREIFLGSEYFFTLPNDKPTIIDCGSHVGLSVFFFKYHYPHSTVTCFEPSALCREELKNNISLNNLSDIEIKNEAIVGTNTKTGEIFHVKNDLGMACSYLIPTSGTNLQNQVNCIKLSDFIMHDIDLLKIDIERGELDIIDNLVKTKKISLIKNLVLECHNPNELHSIKSSLEANGFTIKLYNTERNCCLIKAQRTRSRCE